MCTKKLQSLVSVKIDPDIIIALPLFADIDESVSCSLALTMRQNNTINFSARILCVCLYVRFVCLCSRNSVGINNKN